jgi:glycosyltransferase involved in cell wall biosynthesis
MIKVLHIIPSLKKGGAERLTLDICNELATRAEVTVKLITFSNENEYSFLTSKLDFEVCPAHYIPSIKGKSQKNIDALQIAINAFDPSIIHLHLFESIMVFSAVILNNRKTIIHFHDNMVQFKRMNLLSLFKKENIAYLYEKQIVLRNHRIKNTSLLAISKDTHSFIKRNLGQRFNTTLLHNAIDLVRFSNDEKLEASIRIVMIGSLVKKKGHELAIRVLANLHKRGLKLQLDILGSGPLKSDLKNQVKENNLGSVVTFHGNVDHPEQFLKQAFCYLHTASYEPFGLVLLEAMSVGLPVVCTDGHGNRDLIIEGENGFLLWKRDASAIADKIALLFEDKLLQKSLGENAVKFAREFGMENYVTKLLTIYKEAISSEKAE